MTSGSGFYLRLTDRGVSGNQTLRSVYAMTRQLSPGRDGNEVTRLRIESNSALTAGPGSDLGVRPGESDPARMLCAVLLLTAATVVIVLTLMWWLV